jgi:molecular chaperone GrpE
VQELFTQVLNSLPLKRVLTAQANRLEKQTTFSSMSEPKQPEQNQSPGGLTGEPSPEELEAAAAANEHEAISELAIAQAEVATLTAKNTELADNYLRAKAESENSRRRADEEVSKARKFALESFAESLLPVADSLEAGLNLPSATPEQIKEGALATLKQLKAALERNRVMQIDPAAGTKFDPHQHQAISVVPSEQEANTVVTVLQKGYLIADRVLRPALVTVSAPK